MATAPEACQLTHYTDSYTYKHTSVLTDASRIVLSNVWYLYNGGSMQPALHSVRNRISADILALVCIHSRTTVKKNLALAITSMPTLVRAFSFRLRVIVPPSLLRQGESEKISFIKTYVLKCKFVINEYRLLSAVAPSPYPESIRSTRLEWPTLPIARAAVVVHIVRVI